MALHWSVTAVKDHATITTHPADLEKTDSQRWSPVTDSLVWATMSVGINRITEDNAEEFFNRLAMVEQATGASLTSPEGPIFLTKEDVVEHIGLSTNASNKTKQQFKEYLFNILQEESRRKAHARHQRDPRSVRAQLTERVATLAAEAK